MSSLKCSVTKKMFHTIWAIWYGPYHLIIWDVGKSNMKPAFHPNKSTFLQSTVLTYFEPFWTWHTICIWFESAFESLSCQDWSAKKCFFEVHLRFSWQVSFKYSEYDIIYIGFIVNSVLIFNQLDTTMLCLSLLLISSKKNIQSITVLIKPRVTSRDSRVLLHS